MGKTPGPFQGLLKEPEKDVATQTPDRCTSVTETFSFFQIYFSSARDTHSPLKRNGSSPTFEKPGDEKCHLRFRSEACQSLMFRMRRRNQNRGPSATDRKMCSWLVAELEISVSKVTAMHSPRSLGPAMGTNST